MLRRMYLVSSEYVAGRKQSPPPPTPTTEMPTTPTQQESRTKSVKKKKTTKHGRRRWVTEGQHPYDKWVKMRSEMQEADIERKTLIQKIADFLQKVLPNSNAHPEQTMAAPQPPPPESPDTQEDFNSEAPASPSGPPSCHAKVKAYSKPLLNARCPRTRKMRGLPAMSRPNRR